MESKLESKMDQLRIELQTELHKILESFRIGMIIMFKEMFEKKDDVIAYKQEPLELKSIEDIQEPVEEDASGDLTKNLAESIRSCQF